MAWKSVKRRASVKGGDWRLHIVTDITLICAWSIRGWERSALGEPSACRWRMCWQQSTAVLWETDISLSTDSNSCTAAPIPCKHEHDTSDSKPKTMMKHENWSPPSSACDHWPMLLRFCCIAEIFWNLQTQKGRLGYTRAQSLGAKVACICHYEVQWYLFKNNYSHWL